MTEPTSARTTGGSDATDPILGVTAGSAPAPHRADSGPGGRARRLGRRALAAATVAASLTAVVGSLGVVFEVPPLFDGGRTAGSPSAQPEIAELLSQPEADAVASAGAVRTAVVRLPDAPRRVAGYFDTLDYRLASVREDTHAVPRVYLAELPAGLHGYEPTEARKRLFLRAMLPLVLRANERVRETRARIERIAARLADGHAVAAVDRAWLLTTAADYGLAAERLQEVALDRLLRRVDSVPPSLALTQSILESGWGTSRFAQRGNALFGQRTWNADTPGLAPKEASGFKVRAFDTLQASVDAYLHNLNVSAAYAELRRQRAAMRAADRPLDGARLAGTLTAYSEEGAHYVEKLRGLMRHNGLAAFDDARLRRQAIAQRVIPDSGVSDVQVALAPPPGT